MIGIARSRPVGSPHVSDTVPGMPSALDTPQGASALAESLLPQLGNRWLHTQAVAARAQEAAATRYVRQISSSGAAWSTASPARYSPCRICGRG